MNHHDGLYYSSGIKRAKPDLEELFIFNSDERHRVQKLLYG